MIKNKDIVIVRRSNSAEDQRTHFIERLKERHEIMITEKEYDDLCNPYGIFHGVFAKQGKKTIGWLMIHNTKVWVLRDGATRLLATCYPASVEHSNTSMIRACFAGLSKFVAIQILQMYNKEALAISKMKFESVKQAAIFFFGKTHFPTLHIDKYKYGSVATSKVCNLIRSIVTGESEHVKIYLRRVKKKK